MKKGDTLSLKAIKKAVGLIKKNNAIDPNEYDMYMPIERHKVLFAKKLGFHVRKIKPLGKKDISDGLFIFRKKET